LDVLIGACSTGSCVAAAVNRAGAERIGRIPAVAIAVLAAIGAVLVDGDLEVTLLMVAAVITGLVCLDTSMEWRLQSFAPWAFLSVAPMLKTVPVVWFALRSESGLLFARYDHAGSLLFGVSIFAAVAVLARPANRLGSSTVRFDAAVIFGSAVTGALAGASVAFLIDSGFGSATAGRLLETPTWFVLAGILAASPIAASHVRSLSFGLTGVLSTACVTAGLLALSVAGREIDTGWWAVLFAALAVSAVGVDGTLGERTERDRPSSVAVAVALIVGLVAAGSAIAARSDRTAWTPGWALLGAVALAMFGLAMASKPLDGQARELPGSQDKGVDTGEHSLRARAGALQAMEPNQPGDERHPAVNYASRYVGAPRGGFADSAGTAAATALSPAEGPSTMSRPESHATAARLARIEQSEPAQSAPPESNLAESKVPDPPVAQASLSDTGLVASAQAAAAVRIAPQKQRHALAPLAQAHHFDPSTGLLSAAGLQHAIAQTFDVPRHAGHITMLLFMIRDLDRIEQDHGRLASAAVTREVADRVGSLLPEGTGARFARSSFAVIFLGDRSNVAETTQWLARVLLQLRAPVDGGSLGDRIDVAAGMAQCYESEDAAQFVKRANLGLARAVQVLEPTLVAMP
jgi:GGDEF domain-containing protein